MRHLVALVCAAGAAVASGCAGQAANPASPTSVTASAAGTFDYYDDYPAPDPYDPYPPPATPFPPSPGAGGLVLAPGYGATAGGTLVTITGGGFTPGTTVMFGTAAAATTEVIDAATITVTTPPSVSGWVDVIVSIPGADPLSLPGGFTYADEAAAGAVATITITPAGNTPKAIVVPVGSRVRFVNNDVRPHDLESDPHPTHTDCPDANGAGFLVPGGSGQTGALMTQRTCGVHDHIDPGNPAWMSRIVIR